MSPTPEQQTAVERLYENEALIDNLTSDVAQPLLQLAEEQILAGADAEAVYAAVREVNQRGVQDAAAMLATVRQVLPLAGSKEADHPQAPPAEMKQEKGPKATKKGRQRAPLHRASHRGSERTAAAKA